MRKGNVYLTSSNKKLDQITVDPKSISNERTIIRVKDPILKLNTKDKSSADNFKMRNIHKVEDEVAHFKHPEHPEKLGATLENDFVSKTKSSRRMKIEELNHDFNLFYGEANFSKKLVSLIDTKKYYDPLTCKENKQIIEKQNFNYYKDGGIGKVNINSLLNLDPNKIKYDKSAFKKDPLPMDYWKSNFDFLQVDKTNKDHQVIFELLKL